MPVVPRLTEPGVATQPLPGVRANPGPPAPGVNFGGALSSIQQIIQEEQQKANQIAVNDADNKASALRDKVLYGTPDDPSQGILNKRGRDAFAAPTQALGDWQKGLSDITGSLANDQQKLAFQNRIDGYDHALHLEIQSHIASERQRYDAETTDAYVTNRVNDASRFFADPKSVDANIDLATAAIADHGRRTGLPAESITEQQQKATSAARLSVVQQMLVATESQGGGDLRASSYLAAHRAELTARDLAEADRLTEAGSVKGESYRVSDDILKSATTLSDALGKAASTQDPKVREETSRLLRQHFADLAASDRDARNGAFTRASQAIQQGATVDELPLADRVLLSPDEYLQLDHVSQRIRNPVVETKPAYYTHWMNMAGVSGATQDEFLHHDFGADRAAGKLSESDFHHFTGLQLQLRNKETATDARAEKAADAQTTRFRRSEESATFRATVAAQKAQAARETMAANPSMAGALKFLPPVKAVTVPRWMVDSAQADPEYKDYLKFHGVDVDSAAAKPLRPTPKAPGAPIP